MDVLKMLVVAGLLCANVSAFAQARQTYRDAQGRNVGSVSTDRYGKTTYRDSMGRNMGTSSTDRYG